jgi:hypothetical protein
MLGIRVRVKEADRYGLHAIRDERVDRRIKGVEIEGDELRAVGSRPFGHLAPEVSRNQRVGRRVEPVVDVRAGAAPQLENVPEARRRDESHRRPALLQERVQDDGGAMEQPLDVGDGRR